MNEEKVVFHIDVNNAFLSWSAVKLLNNGYKTDIRNIPAIIGGDESKRRGVVLAKSPVAKKYGIKTAETIYSARRKCPDLKVFQPDHKYYKIISNKLFCYLKKYSPVMEQLSIDECFLDMSNMHYLYNDLELLAIDIKDDIKNKFGFTVNIGIANNKLCAKMASDFLKPDMIHTLYNNEISSKLWPLPVDRLYMVGKSTSRKLNNLGIKTIKDLATLDVSFLKQRFGVFGKVMWEYANGIDNSLVCGFQHTNKCISISETLAVDLDDVNKIKKILLRQTNELSRNLRKKSLYASTVAINIKTYNFIKYSKQAKLINPTKKTDDILNCVYRLFDLAWDGIKIRNIGIRLGDFTKSVSKQISFFDHDERKENNIESTLDNIRDKYGDNIIISANLLNKDE